jgi:alpha-galactosidase
MDRVGSPPGWVRRWVGVLLAAVLATLLVGPAAAATKHLKPIKGRPKLQPTTDLTPYMGVNTWYGFGSTLDEQTVVQLAKAVVGRRLKAVGYRYVWIDAGWWHGERDASGNIAVDPGRWPHGMKWLAAYIHHKGLLAGIYTDAGNSGCFTGGSYGHYQSDVNTFAAWGFDALKVDFCGGNAMHLDPGTAYKRFQRAILRDRPHRRMLFNVCNGAIPNEYGMGEPQYEDSAYASYRFAPAIASSWRTGPDVGVPGAVRFDHVLRNLDLDARHRWVAGHGHWNDPDYLVPEEGMSPSEARAQFTMWAMVAAPLVVSDDVTKLSPSTIATLTNREVVAIDQDPLGIQGWRAAREGLVDVWVKPLAGHRWAVAFLNRGAAAEPAHAAALLIGIRAQGKLVFRDLWGHRTMRVGRQIRVTVPAQSVVLFRVSKTTAPKPGLPKGRPPAP